MLKTALINSEKINTIRRYLPGNYQAARLGTFTLVYGYDQAGWTLEDYVLPRMAQWGLQPIENTVLSEEVRLQWGPAALSLTDPDDPFGAPASEVHYFGFGEWVGQYESIGYEGFVPMTPQQVLVEVMDTIQSINDNRPEFDYIPDPDFDFEDAAEFFNHEVEQVSA
jgi:hypothetical protein